MVIIFDYDWSINPHTRPKSSKHIQLNKNYFINFVKYYSTLVAKCD